MQRGTNEPTIGELFAELSRETSSLVRQEMKLATSELGHKASRVGKDVGMLAVGGAVIYAGFLAVIAAVIIVLAAVLPWWLAALLVGVVVAATGGFLVQRGLDALKHENLAPKATIATLKEDAAWAKEQTH